MAVAWAAPLQVPAHFPQLLGSAARFTHEPPQLLVPAGQVEVHLPLVQTSFCWHFTPHPPQLVGS